MHSIESRLAVEPSNILFAGVYVGTFEPGNFKVWGSERIRYSTTCSFNRRGEQNHKDFDACPQNQLLGTAEAEDHPTHYAKAQLHLPVHVRISWTPTSLY